MATRKSPPRAVSPYREEVVAALDIAVKKAGGTKIALARAIGCTRANVSAMYRYGRVHVDRARAIESLYGISRRKLMPEVFR